MRPIFTTRRSLGSGQADALRVGSGASDPSLRRARQRVVTAPPSADREQRQLDARLRDGVGFCAVVFVGVRLLLSLVAVVAVGTVHPPSTATSGAETSATTGWHNFVDGTERWDAGWFERIARDGYEPDDESGAFFPGYPLAIRATTAITPLGELSAGLMISNLAFLGGLIAVFALTSYEFGKGMARRTTLLLASFPASFFFLAPYSESLFLLTSALCFWWARHRVWERAAVAGLVAALTRSVGVLLVPALLVEAWAEVPAKRTRAITWSLVPLLGPAMYSAYWLIRTGDALQPFHAQDSWHRTFVFPLVTLGNALWLGISGIADPRGIYWTADLLLTTVILIPLALRWRLLKRAYLVYVVASLLVILSYPLPERPLLSAPRFLIVLFPAFWPLASICTRKRLVPLLAIALVGFAAMAIAFMNWGFVF